MSTVAAVAVKKAKPAARSTRAVRVSSRQRLPSSPGVCSWAFGYLGLPALATKQRSKPGKENCCGSQKVPVRVRTGHSLKQTNVPSFGSNSRDSWPKRGSATGVDAQTMRNQYVGMHTAPDPQSLDCREPTRQKQVSHGTAKIANIQSVRRDITARHCEERALRGSAALMRYG